MMRAAVLVLVAMLVLNVHAQSVLASSGSEGNAGGLQWAWTIGEPMTVSGTSPTVIGTQGFHQPPADFSTAVVRPDDTRPDWLLFPNPTREFLHLRTTGTAATHALVLDALGRQVAHWAVQQQAWSVAALAAGTYRLRLLDRNGAELHTLEFIVTP